jgi:3-methyladenine DNA glycosylase/8-oxoguanine DNA glycosylase
MHGARPRRRRDPWVKAIAHLRRVDPYCAAVIDRIGPCQLEPRPDRFGTLVRAIIGQQISTRAATSIDQRVRDLGGTPHEPSALLKLGEPALRGAGLSGVKARYILNLAEAVAGGHAPLDEFDDWDDDAIIARLTAIKGIGRWTAEMFLIFALNRPDVLPVGDLGVRVALRDRYGLPELPKPSACVPLAEHWRPFRTIATWYFWRDINASRPGDNGGMSAGAPPRQ